MYAIAAIGFLTIALSAIMIANPHAFGRGIMHFARKPYFHMAEIAIRLVLGAVLILFASGTQYPLVISAVGYLFVFAGLVLMIAGSARHRAFAEKSSGFIALFRPAGFCSLAFGAFVLCAALEWM